MEFVGFGWMFGEIAGFSVKLLDFLWFAGCSINLLDLRIFCLIFDNFA